MSDLTRHATIHLAVAFDRNYLNQFFALSSSVFHHHEAGRVSWHVIATGINYAEKKTIETYVSQKDSKILFYEIEDREVSGLVLLNNWTSAVYYRLYFPLLLPPSVTRFIYLDMDTIVVNSLYDLWNTDLDNSPLAAVKDVYVAKEPYSQLHIRKSYFNSGVMLINVTLWNSLAVTERTLAHLRAHPEQITYVDQDALNIIVGDNCKLISEKFNFTYSHIPDGASKKNLTLRLKELVVIHFTLTRPWEFLCKNRYRNLYKFYLRESPGRQNNITDFSMSKIPSFIGIRLNEIYLDLPFQVKSFLKKCIDSIPFIK